MSADAPTAAPPSVAEAGAPIDLSQLRSLVGDKPDNLRRFLRLFVTNTEPLLAKLAGAVAARDGAAAKLLSHTLKGSSGNIGAGALAAASARLGHAAAEEDWVTVSSICPGLFEAGERAMAYANAF